MKIPNRVCGLLGAALILLFTGGALAAPRMFEAAGLDFWSVPRLKARIAETKRQIEETDARLEAVKRLRLLKVELAEDYVRGRLSLAEALERLRELGRGIESPALLCQFYHCDSEEEALTRNLFGYVAFVLDRHVTAASGAVRAQMRLELEELIER